jgi:small subunit ribosomal protein S13
MFLARKHLVLKQTFASALKPLYGIGSTRYRLLLTRFSGNRKSMLNSVSKSGLLNFVSFVDNNYSTNEQVTRIEKKILRKHLKNGSYKGIRFLQGLPARGQRTHSNHRTARRMKAKYLKLKKN